MAYKEIVEYGVNKTIGHIWLSTLSNGEMDNFDGSMDFGRDHVSFYFFFLSLFVCESIFIFTF